MRSACFAARLAAAAFCRSSTVDGTSPSLPTDRHGFNNFTVSIDKSTALAPQVQDVCGKLKEHITKYYLDEGAEPGWGLLPSTALAVGYFENFVQRVTTALNYVGDYTRSDVKDKTFHVDRLNWKLAVYLPSTMQEVNGDAWKNELTKCKLVEIQVAQPGGPRGYRCWTGPDNPADSLVIYDMPTTLEVASQAITKMLTEPAAADLKLAFERARSDFARNLLRQAGKKQLEIIDQAELYQRCGVALPQDDR
jgi:hypothetical protein